MAVTKEQAKAAREQVRRKSAEQKGQQKVTNGAGIAQRQGKPTMAAVPAKTIVVSRRDHVETARQFLRAEYVSAAGEPLLHCHHDDLYVWAGSHYRAMPEREIKSRLQRFLDGATILDDNFQPQPYEPNRARIEEVVAAVKNGRFLTGESTAPFWIDGRAGPDPKNLLCCKNGVLDLGKRQLYPASPKLFALNAIDFEYEAQPPTPAHWLKFLSELWSSDQEAIETLQEIFGYCLTADTRQQKIFLVIGPKRSGKGTIARVLKSLLGPPNVAGPTLAGLETNFGMATLIGRPLAIVSDARMSRRSDPAVIMERLLTISGEDAIDIDRKHREAWTGTLPTRFLILTNLLPRLGDASGALASRFVLLSLENSFYGREDQGLTDRLLTELPGILSWSLDGLDRLRQRGYFRQPASSADQMNELETLGSPVAAFVRERCTVAPGRQVIVQTLFDAFIAWNEAQGRERHGDVQAFGRDLRAVVPTLKVTRPRVDGKQERHYEGVTLGRSEPNSETH